MADKMRHQKIWSQLFNNEHLSEHAISNPIYEWFRSLFYGWVIEAETFRVILRGNVPEVFEFNGIYSGDSTVDKDNVHGDRVKPYEEVPKHKIKYYFVSTQHPIVFYQYCQSCDVWTWYKSWDLEMRNIHIGEW